MTQTFPRFCPHCGSAVAGEQVSCSTCHKEFGILSAQLSAVKSQVEQLPSETSEEARFATTNLLKSFTGQRSRRSFFKGAIAAASGIGVVGAGALYGPALVSAAARQQSFRSTATQSKSMFRMSSNAADSIVSILTVARTAEQLAVTFYSNGLANADKLGLKGDNLTYIKAALYEEQIHQKFFAANGGQSLAETFSFPSGASTFTDLKTFITTQQQLEGVFDSAFLAAIMEFAQLGRPDLAQIAGQVACIEAEHRVLGRTIANMSPADNWAYTPVLIATVGDAPALVQKAGYLSPTSGNSYTYKEYTDTVAGVEQLKPFSASAAMVGNG